MTKRKATNRRPQTSKPAKSGNTPYIEAMLGKRSSNAAGFHNPPSRRKPKHVKRDGWKVDE